MLNLIDGGNSTHLRELGFKLCPKIWSAEILKDNPEAIEKVHDNFINAGSQYITTTNYSVTPYYQNKKYFDLDSLISLSGEIARKRAKNNIKVLGSLPPYSESYSKDMIPEISKLREFYHKTASLLDKNIDIFLCETMSTLEEVVTAIASIREISEKPIWVSFSLSNHKQIKCGTDLLEVYQTLAELRVSAMLFNCCPIDIIDQALEYLKDSYNPNIKLGAYPNLHIKPIVNNFNLEKVTNENNIVYSSIKPEEFRDIVIKWKNEKNISIVGGCCGMGPEFIRILKGI